MRLLTLPLVAALLSPVFASDASSGMSIVTLNMAKETSVDRVLREWNASPPIRQADILLLQEVKEESGVPCIAKRLGEAMGLHVSYSPEGPGVTDRGLAILSRFPLRDTHVVALKRFDLRFRSRSRFALAATAETPWGPVRLENVHLDTRLNAADRLAQLAPAVEDSKRFGARRIVAGDFNSNPFYWIDHTLPLPAMPSQAVAVDRFMQKQGFHTPIAESSTTFDYLGMHLDWIWMTGLRPIGSRVLPLDFSDHHAVWTQVRFE